MVKKIAERILTPDDPIFTSGPQVFTPIARPRPAGGRPAEVPPKPAPVLPQQRSAKPMAKRERVREPGGIVTVDLDLMCMTLEEYYGEEIPKPEKPKP